MMMMMPRELWSKRTQNEAKAMEKLWVQCTYKFSGAKKPERNYCMKDFWTAGYVALYVSLYGVRNPETLY